MPGTEVQLKKGEHDYYVYWKFNKRMGLSPKEVDELDPETKNALWVILKYEDEKIEHDNFIAQSKAFHAKNKQI